MTPSPLSPTAHHVAVLLDRYARATLPAPALLDALAPVLGADRDALPAVLAPHLAVLDAAAEVHGERSARDCEWCVAGELCARHRRWLHEWMDARDGVARAVTDMTYGQGEQVLVTEREGYDGPATSGAGGASTPSGPLTVPSDITGEGARS